MTRSNITRKDSNDIRTKTLKISGDFSSFFLKLLLLLNNGKKDCINPFIQNELTKAATNKKYS
jgi:hypothetical protein